MDIRSDRSKPFGRYMIGKPSVDINIAASIDLVARRRVVRSWLGVLAAVCAAATSDKKFISKHVQQARLTIRLQLAGPSASGSTADAKLGLAKGQRLVWLLRLANKVDVPKFDDVGVVLLLVKFRNSDENLTPLLSSSPCHMSGAPEVVASDTSFRGPIAWSKA